MAHDGTAMTGTKVGTDTRARILDTAERLFAETGLAATSLRQITTAAGVNLAAVHYHFGSKDGLVQAVYERHIAPVNRERLRLLDLYEATPSPGAAQLEQLVEALVGPVLRLKKDDPVAARSVRCLIGRIYCEPGDQMKSVLCQFDEIRERFPAAISLALPHLSRTELLWRVHFMIGATLHTTGAGQLLEQVSEGPCDLNNTEETVRQLVHFLCAGLRSASTAAEEV